MPPEGCLDGETIPFEKVKETYSLDRLASLGVSGFALNSYEI
jgi:hypothetical protein